MTLHGGAANIEGVIGILLWKTQNLGFKPGAIQTRLYQAIQPRHVVGSLQFWI